MGKLHGAQLPLRRKGYIFTSERISDVKIAAKTYTKGFKARSFSIPTALVVATRSPSEKVVIGIGDRAFLLTLLTGDHGPGRKRLLGKLEPGWLVRWHPLRKQMGGGGGGLKAGRRLKALGQLLGGAPSPLTPPPLPPPLLKRRDWEPLVSTMALLVIIEQDQTMAHRWTILKFLRRFSGFRRVRHSADASTWKQLQPKEYAVGED